MNRRDALKAIAGAVPAAALAQQKLNVVWIMSDEHSPHVAGWLGNKLIRTPNLDSLARRGAAFSNSYCQNPVCVPSRAAFLTSRMPSNVGVIGNSGGLDPSVPTMGAMFKRAGYVAQWIGKTHWGGQSGFDQPHGYNDTEMLDSRQGHTRLPEDAAITDIPASKEADTGTKNFALKFLDENKGKAFFVGVSFRKPHFPFVVQKEFYDLYKDKLDVPRTGHMVDDLPEVSKKEREGYGFAKLDDAQIKKARAVYYAMVTYMDGLVGEVLKKIDDLGLREKTIVVYTADHGEMAGEHGLWYKNSLYEASVRIPMLLAAPGRIPAGTKVTAPVMNIDLLPTLCDLCGITKEASFEGHSMLPLIAGKEDGKQRYALAESFRAGYASRMIRTGPWKYCYYVGGGEQLFNVENDPDEITNLVKVPKHAELVASLKKSALDGWNIDKFKKNKKKKG